MTKCGYGGGEGEGEEAERARRKSFFFGLVGGDGDAGVGKRKTNKLTDMPSQIQKRKFEEDWQVARKVVG